MHLDGTRNVETRDGNMPVFFSRPDNVSVTSSVILYMDVFGPREELFDFCRRFAANGYLALLPSLFYRRDRESYPPANAKGEPVDSAAFAAGRETTIAMSAADTGALIEAAKAGVFGASATGFGSIGYCMGGRHALSALASYPSDILAGLSLHGGQLVKDEGPSPHELIAALDRPFHFAFAEDDRTCPPEHQALIEREAAKAGPHVTIAHHAAAHGWSFPTRWSFDEAVSEANWQMALEMFATHLPRTAPL